MRAAAAAGLRRGYDAARRPSRSTSRSAPGHEADYDLVRRIRASINVLGPLLARCGQAKVALPGGDAIGSRPLDFHLAGLTKLGAESSQRARLPRRRAPGG